MPQTSAMTRSRPSRHGCSWRERRATRQPTPWRWRPRSPQVPPVRIVLLRTADREGLVFHTHRLSRKAVEMEAHPEVALLLHWNRPIHRQVGVEGRAERLEDELSDAYFFERPAGGRPSAWASPQSQVVSGRDELERRWQEARCRFPDDGAIPRPAEWGGYRVVPECFEFWQGREDRLHDRIRFRRAATPG